MKTPDAIQTIREELQNPWWTSKYSKEQLREQLKCLGAWRLLCHHQGDWKAAYAHEGAAEYLGPKYKRKKAWIKAAKVVERTMKEQQEFMDMNPDAYPALRAYIKAHPDVSYLEFRRQHPDL